MYVENKQPEVQKRKWNHLLIDLVKLKYVNQPTTENDVEKFKSWRVLSWDVINEQQSSKTKLTFRWSLSFSRSCCGNWCVYKYNVTKAKIITNKKLINQNMENEKWKLNIDIEKNCRKRLVWHLIYIFFYHLCLQANEGHYC